MTPGEAERLIWDWWWVAVSAIVAVGFIVQQIKAMFKD